MWELASRSSDTVSLRDAAIPFMDDLHAVVRQHTQLAVLDGAEVLYLETKSARGAEVVKITRTASRLPVHACSSGLVLLAHAPLAAQDKILANRLEALTPLTVTDPNELRRQLAETRYRGYAAVHGAVHEQATGVAVPIFGPDEQGGRCRVGDHPERGGPGRACRAGAVDHGPRHRPRARRPSGASLTARLVGARTPGPRRAGACRLRVRARSPLETAAQQHSRPEISRDAGHGSPLGRERASQYSNQSSNAA